MFPVTKVVSVQCECNHYCKQDNRKMQRIVGE